MKKLFFASSVALLLFMTGCVEKETKPVVYGKADNTPYDISECQNELNHGADIKVPKIDKIVVYKSKKKLYAYRDGVVVKEFPISLGKHWNEGNKVFKGDYRTPEGTFKIVRKKCDDRLYRNLLINFPTQADLIRCKAAGSSDPGGLITIHGQPKWNADGHGDAYTLQHDWTEGCVAVPNSAMKFLWEATTLGVTVEIHS